MVIRVILLAVGTALAVSFLIQLRRGKQYDNIVGGLDPMEYPLCALYTVGFAWSTTSVFRFRGKLAARLKREAGLLREEQYADFYANIAWAQALTLIHMMLAFTFLAAGLVYSSFAFVLAVGIFFTVFMGAYSLTSMKNTLASRTQECDMNLPEVVSTMAILLNSGMMLRDAWRLVGSSGSTALHELMRKATDDMKNGASEADAIYHFGLRSGSAEVKKFTSAMLQYIEWGGAEFTLFMQRQSSDLWNLKRQKMLQLGEKASTQLLMPILLIFGGVIIIVIAAAFAGALF